MMFAQTLKSPPMIPRMLFEDPWPIIVVLVVAWAILRVAGRRAELPRAMKASWGFLAVIAVVMGVSMLVTTPREKLVRALGELVEAVEEGDVEAFHRLVPPDATATYFDVPFDRTMVDSRLAEADIEDLTVLSEESGLIDGRNGVSYIRVRARVGAQGLEALDISDWAIVWKLDDSGQWQAVEFRHQGSGVQKLFGDE